MLEDKIVIVQEFLTPRQLKIKKYMEQIEQREKHNAEVQERKDKYKLQYDKLFALIMKSKKGSDWHKMLLKCEMKYHLRTKKLISENQLYFSDRRKEIFGELERKGCFGERPGFEDDPEGSLDARDFNGVVHKPRRYIEH
jgi:hypothetical protein